MSEQDGDQGVVERTLDFEKEQVNGAHFDYRVVAIHARHSDVLEKGLQEYGSEGWELIFVHLLSPNEYQCIFRKRT